MIHRIRFVLGEGGLGIGRRVRDGRRVGPMDVPPPWGFNMDSQKQIPDTGPTDDG